MNVAAILKQKGTAVVTASVSTSIRDVVSLLAEKRIGSVVVSGGRGDVTGIISERDIIRLLAREGAAGLERTAGEVMTKSVVTCTRSDTIDDLMARMTARRFRHLPVVESGRLNGIVSIGDVVKQRIAEVELEANAMRDYIRTG